MNSDRSMTASTWHRCFHRSLLLILAGAMGGCGPAPKPAMETFPVSGFVKVNGEPAVRAEVRLRPKSPLKDPLNRSIEPYGFVGPDGFFQISTYREKDGAPPGDYAVTVTWPIVTVEGGEDVFGPDRLGGRFASASSPVTTINVFEGSNLIPTLELQHP